MEKTNNPIRAARLAAGLTYQAAADFLEMPKRTLENYEGGQRKLPSWAEKLIVEKLESAGGAE